jgi:hypothetical protein
MKFYKFIHHDPEDAIDQNARKIRLNNTIFAYERFFGSPKYLDVWNKTLSSFGTKLNNTIYVKIMHTFDVNNDGNRVWKKNDLPYDNKVLMYKYKAHDTLEHLKYILSKKTGHNMLAIRIFDHRFKTTTENMSDINTTVKYVHINGSRQDLSNDILLAQQVRIHGNNFVAILEEMTSCGYC